MPTIRIATHEYSALECLVFEADQLEPLQRGGEPLRHKEIVIPRGWALWLDTKLTRPEFEAVCTEPLFHQLIEDKVAVVEYCEDLATENRLLPYRTERTEEQLFTFFYKP